MYHRRTQRRSPIPLLILVLLLVGGGIYLFRGQLLSSTVPGLAATSSTADVTPPDTKDPSPIAPSPTATPTSPVGVAETYLRAWEQQRYEEMYQLLSSDAKASISAEKFVERYKNIAEMATIQSLQARLTATQPSPTVDGGVELPFHVEMQTRRVGDIVQDNFLPLVYESPAWRVQWSPSLIFKELTADYLIRLFPLNPTRGTIYDRKGRPLATEGFVVSVGVVPAEVSDLKQVVAALQPFAQLSEAAIQEKMDNAQPDWFVPLAEFPPEREEELKGKLESVQGIVLRRKAARVYPAGSVASHIIGYTSVITAEELPRLAEKGYEPDDRVGRAGVEGWAEEDLKGKRGGKLAVVTPKGEVVTIVKDQPAQQGRNVYLSIDLDVQRKAEEVLGDKVGSLIVMDPRDNSVLAMASYPRFDPNKFVMGFTPEEWEALNSDPRHPFLNRPVASVYPTGSVFKPITMAAGIESGGFTPSSSFFCNGIWFGLGAGIGFRDWTPAGHGNVTLARGITTSCNIVFYELGKKLGSIDPYILPNMARRFGLGQPTGIQGVNEVAGNVPDPAWKEKNLGEPWYPGDSVNLAIGQGYFEATPLQMANVYSALATQGQLRPPVLVQKITDVDGNVVKSFEAKPAKPLGLPESYWAALRDAMIKGAMTPDGTAYYAVLQNHYQSVPIAAKTGSAENQGPNSHAWFGGYAPANDPQVVVLVMLEGGGAGGQFAAPLGVQIVQFFFPNPRS